MKYKAGSNKIRAETKKIENKHRVERMSKSKN